MGKKKQFSIYDFEKRGVVSIWVAKVPLSELPDDYFEENFTDESKPFTRFSLDFGFDFFNFDLVDTNAAKDGPRDVGHLVAECSFSSSYAAEVAKAAKKRGLDTTQYVLLIFDTQYSPRRTR